MEGCSGRRPLRSSTPDTDQRRPLNGQCIRLDCTSTNQKPLLSALRMPDCCVAAIPACGAVRQVF
eukprot:6090088-Alexandrium_andersonii.AAC.1